jgi:coenzyme F420-reducing hydrogenase alpha subunit
MTDEETLQACNGNCDHEGCPACEVKEQRIDAMVNDNISKLRVMTAMADDISDSIDSSDALAVPTFIEEEDSLVIELHTARKKSITATQNVERIASRRWR